MFMQFIVLVHLKGLKVASNGSHPNPLFLAPLIDDLFVYIFLSLTRLASANVLTVDEKFKVPLIEHA